MSHDFQQWLQGQGLQVRPQGIWAVVGEVQGEFGWKLHLSSTQTQAIELLGAATPILGALEVPFKVARDADVLAMLNEGSFGPTQVGKFITAYPHTPESSLEAAHALIEATRRFSGPSILTDLHIGGVVYARYGSYVPPMKRDRLGNVSPEDPAGAGTYRVPFEAPDGVPNPFHAYMRLPRECNRIAPLGPGYLLLEPLNVRAKGSVYLALDLRCQGNVRKIVLKEARRHCVSDEWGRDIQDRLRHQAAMHALLAADVRIPEAGELFDHDGKLYLPLQYVPGRSFSERVPQPFSALARGERAELLRQLSRVAAAVAGLHARGIIHRDLSPNNIRVDDGGEVWLLDLELSHRVGDPAPPFSLGTAGFMSPQQRAGADPSTTDDVFAVGALLIMGLTGMDPHRIQYSTVEREAQLMVVSGAPAALCALAARCVDPRAEIRPAAAELRRELLDWAQLALVGDTARHRPQIGSLARTVTHSLEWLLCGAAKDEAYRMWVSPEIEAHDNDATLKSPHAYKVYRSCSRGVAGVLLAISRLRRAGFESKEAVAQCTHAVDWLLRHEPTPDDQMPGLHFGEAGVAVAISEAVASGLVPTGSWLMPYLSEALSGPIDWPDLTHGAAGQGVAALSCARLLGEPRLAAFADRCAAYLLQRQEAQGDWKLPVGVPGMEGLSYTGFAHGMAGIAYFLACYARLRPQSDLARAAADAAVLAGARLAHLARRADDGSLTWPMWIGGEETWHWWCHGSPGIAIAFLQLSRLKNSEEFARLARDALHTLPRQLRHNNLSQCHGLSGIGEILLHAHELLGEREWLDRAHALGTLVQALARDEGGQAVWLVENPFNPTADLMIGCSGVAHFLARLLTRSAASLGMPLAVD